MSDQPKSPNPLGQLAEMIRDLDAHIERRAQEITGERGQRCAHLLRAAINHRCEKESL
jgi:hypothetical protein